MYIKKNYVQLIDSFEACMHGYKKKDFLAFKTLCTKFGLNLPTDGS